LILITGVYFLFKLGQDRKNFKIKKGNKYNIKTVNDSYLTTLNKLLNDIKKDNEIHKNC